MTEFNNNKFIPNTPKTYEQFVLEDKQLTLEQQQNLYPELVYEDISEQRGYGPVFLGNDAVDPEVKREQRKSREKEVERKTNQGLCIWDNCQSSPGETGFCAFHERKRRQEEWVIKTVADTAASAFIPGYSAAKAVVGTVSWVAGQATGSRSASDFGSNAIKNELESEAWDIAGTLSSGSSKFGEHFSTGMGIVSSTIDWIDHQKHVDRGEDYRSDCPVCRS